MTKQEYTAAKKDVIKKHGQPVYDMSTPVNECAIKLVELRRSYIKAKTDIAKTKRLADNAKELVKELKINAVSVPEEIIRAEWMVSFNEQQKAIALQWSRNIKQTLGEIADATNTTIQQVRTTLSLEAFQHLRSHLAMAYKNLLPLEASAALRDCLTSPTENVRFNAIKLVLLDAGLYKGEQLGIDINKNERVLDKETEERLRKLGDQVLGIGKEDDNI